MNDTSQFIRVQDLTYSYEDGTQALRGINLSVSDGEFIAFIGQNGSGKTTLAKCLNGLFKPTSGVVLVDGLDSKNTPIVQMVKRVGYVFQNPDHQLFNNNCADEIAYGPHNIGLEEGEVQARVLEAAKVVGLGQEYFHEHPFFLNKGMRQRVAIASILALKPKVIIVDEPTTGQDIRQSLEIMDFLTDLNQNYGHIVIFVTHDMPIVSRYAKRVVMMGGGQIIADGPPAEVYAQPENLAKAFVEPPQITQLAQALADKGFLPGTLSVEEMIAQYQKNCL
ncbi:MAG: ATP-binding cassette domain-containing protein [Leptolinea sp.]